MKRKTLLALAVLLTAIACLFTSCSASVEPPKEEEGLAYVTFGNGGSRSLSTEYGIKSYGELFWFYTAVKQDGFGFTGQKTEQTRINDTTGLNGTITLSQGAWKFELFAYERLNAQTGAGENLVYQGESATIVLKGGETRAVPVSVELKGDYGALDFSNAYFAWHKDTPTQEVGDGDVYLRINIKGNSDNKDASGNPIAVDTTIISRVISPNYKLPSALQFGSYAEGKFPAGYYTCTVQAYVAEDLSETENLNTATVNEGSTFKAAQSFGLRIYGNATTYIKGDLTEGVFADVVFDVAEQDMKVFVPKANGETIVNNIDAVPDTNPVEGVDKSTSVVFDQNALSAVDASSTLQLDVKVTTVEAANNKFNISGTTTDNKSAFAGIDLTLWEYKSNGASDIVSNFTSGKYATVTTYIAKGLDGVVVKYNGDDKAQPIANDDGVSSSAGDLDSNGTVLGYSKTTGKLVFKTNHFSEYYVLAECKAVNITTNVGYTSLKEAVGGAQDGDVIKLIDNVTVTSTLEVNKGITINLNSKSITGDGERTLKFTNGSSIITGTGTITSNVANQANSVIRVGNDDSASHNVGLTIDKNVTISTSTAYGITVFGNSYETLLVYGSITSTGDHNDHYDACAVSTNGSDTTAATIIIHEGATLSAENSNGIYMPSGNLIVYGGSISGTTGIYVKAGNTRVLGGTIIGTGAKKEYKHYTNGGISTGDALVVDSCNYPNAVPVVSVEGGDFISFNNKAVGSYAGNGVTNEVTDFITGGRFSTDPSAHLADGIQLGYGNIVRTINGVNYTLYEILPAGPIVSGNTWTVKPANAQYTLDGAYGSIDGKTIHFSTGEYTEKLILGRPTKYAGSNTEYRHGSHDSTAMSYEAFIAYKNQSGWTEQCCYSRNISNVTFTSDKDVVLPGFVTDAGAHVYGTENSSIYDYVRDSGTYCNDTNQGYYTKCNLSNFTFEGLSFVGNTKIETSAVDTVIDGFVFRKCTFTTNGTEPSKGQALRYYNENNNGNVKNLTVDNCAFKNCYQGIYTQQINGVKVVNSTFDTTGHNAIAIQTGGPKNGPAYIVNHGQVVITGNTFENVGDRIIRFGIVGDGTNITITGNKATNSGKNIKDEKNQEITKVEMLTAGSLPNGFNSFNITDNKWNNDKSSLGLFDSDSSSTN